MSLRPAADDVAELSRGNGGNTAGYVVVIRRSQGASRLYLTPSEPARGLEVGLLVTERHAGNLKVGAGRLEVLVEFSGVIIINSNYIGARD